MAKSVYSVEIINANFARKPYDDDGHVYTLYRNADTKKYEIKDGEGTTMVETSNAFIGIVAKYTGNGIDTHEKFSNMLRASRICPFGRSNTIITLNDSWAPIFKGISSEFKATLNSFDRRILKFLRMDGNVLMWVNDGVAYKLGNINDKQELRDGLMRVSRNDPFYLIIEEEVIKPIGDILTEDWVGGEYNDFDPQTRRKQWQIGCLSKCSTLLLKYAKIMAVVKSNEDKDLVPEEFIVNTSLADFISENAKDFAYCIQETENIPVSCSCDDKELAFNHIHLDDFRNAKDGDTSTWTEWLSKYSEDDQKVIRAYVWSIVNTKNRGSQSLYFYDGGKTGKSAFLRAISKAIGENVVQSLGKDAYTDKFSYSKVYDKRLVIFPDNKNTNVIRSEFFHSITGGDKVNVEFKGEDAFTATMNARVILCSNVMPVIDADHENERRRLIVVKVKDGWTCPAELGDANFEDNLMKQAKAFIGQCEEAYLELCPTDCLIKVPESVAERLDDADDDTKCVYDEFIKNNVMGTEVMVSELKMAFSSVLKNENWNNFVDYMVRNLGVKKTRKKTGMYYVFQSAPSASARVIAELNEMIQNEAE